MVLADNLSLSCQPFSRYAFMLASKFAKFYSLKWLEKGSLMSESIKDNQVQSLADSGETFSARRSNRAINLTGKRFGKLVVVRDTGKTLNKKIVWECRCD